RSPSAEGRCAYPFGSIHRRRHCRAAIRRGGATVNAQGVKRGDAMPGPLCRLLIQHGPDSVDLALPSDTLIGALLPSIVDLVHRGPVAAVEGRQWYLSRVGQEQLDEATSLYDNAIRDGELLLLMTAAAPAPQWTRSDAWHTVIEAADADGVPARFTAMAACLCTAVLGAAALLWSGVVTHGAADVITGGGIAAAAAAGAIVMRRAHPDPILCVTLCVIAVMFVAVAGFLRARRSVDTELVARGRGGVLDVDPVVSHHRLRCNLFDGPGYAHRVDECSFRLRCRVEVARI